MAKTLSDLAKQAAALPGELQKAQRRGVSSGALIMTRGDPRRDQSGRPVT